MLYKMTIVLYNMIHSAKHTARGLVSWKFLVFYDVSLIFTYTFNNFFCTFVKFGVSIFANFLSELLSLALFRPLFSQLPEVFFRLKKIPMFLSIVVVHMHKNITRFSLCFPQSRGGLLFYCWWFIVADHELPTRRNNKLLRVCRHSSAHVYLSTSAK